MFHDDALYKSTFYLLTYLLIYLLTSCYWQISTEHSQIRQTDLKRKIVTAGLHRMPANHLCGKHWKSTLFQIGCQCQGSPNKIITTW